MNQNANDHVNRIRRSIRERGTSFTGAHGRRCDRLAAAWHLWLGARVFDQASPSPATLRKSLATSSLELPETDHEFWANALDAVFQHEWWDFEGIVVAAQMALGRGLAHFFARRMNAQAWHVVDAAAHDTYFSTEAFFETIPRLLTGERRQRLLHLLRQVATDYVAEPKTAAHVMGGIDAKKAAEDFRDEADIDLLFNEPRMGSYLIFGWSRVFVLARRLFPDEALQIYDVLAEPTAVRESLEDLKRPHATEQLIAAISAAPVAFDRETWISSRITTPSLLAVATEHLLEAAEVMASQDSNSGGMPALEPESGRLPDLIEAVVSALLARSDAVALGHQWLASLVRQAELRGFGGRDPKDHRRKTLRLIIERLGASLEPLSDPMGFVHGRAQFRRTPAALAALLTASDKDGLLLRRILMEGSLDVGEQREMSDPEALTRTLGGAILSRCDDPASVWKQGWIDIYPQREAARYCLGGNTERSRHAGFLWIGWSLGALSKMLAESRGVEAAQLWTESWNGALESRISERFDLGFWDVALHHLAAFWAVLREGSAPLPPLHELLAPLMSTSRLATVLLTLQQNGISASALINAEEAGLPLRTQLEADVAAERKEGRGRILSDRAISDISTLLQSFRDGA